MGNRPPRSTYCITPAGRKEFRGKLLKALEREGKHTSLMDPFNLPFSLMGKLPQEILSDYDRIRLLEGRKEASEEVLGELRGIRDHICDILEKDRCKEMDIYARLLLKRGIAHMEAEHSWLDEVIGEIQTGMKNCGTINNHDNNENESSEK